MLHLVELEIGALRDVVDTTDVAVRHTGAGADGRREGRFRAARPLGAVAGRGQVDEVGVHGQQVVGGVAVTLGNARPERLQHDVGAPDQVEHDLPTLFRRVVDRHALLALQHLDATHLGERHEVTDGVTVELLHLDDARAEVGEHGGAERRGVEAAELDDGDAGEWRGIGRARPTGVDTSGRARGSRADRRAVLVECRRGCAELRRRRRHPDQRAGLEHRATLRVDDGLHAAVVRDLRVMEQLGAVAEDLGPHVGLGVERRVPLVEGLLTRPRPALAPRTRSAPAGRDRRARPSTRDRRASSRARPCA